MLLTVNDETQQNWDSLRNAMGPICRKIFQKLGHRVISGPFKGMIVTDQPNWDDGNACLKLLGCYEHELWDAVELAISRKPNAVINVGCAEGYYAIGLKMRLPEVRVIAFDINPRSLQQCEEMAHHNEVELDLKIGCAKPEELQLGYDNALYILDCEADELNLLDPDRCPDLISSDIIVECHDHVWPISYPLAKRFESTHDVDVIEAQMASSYPEYSSLLDPLPIGMKLSALTEKRPYPTIYLSMMAKR